MLISDKKTHLMESSEIGFSGAMESQIAWWNPLQEGTYFSPEEILPAIKRFREVVHIIQHPGGGTLGLAFGGKLSSTGSESSYKLLGSLPPLYPEWLGDPVFCETHGLRFPYLAGAMATGIASTKVVIEMARGGMMGFFGSAGLSPQRTEAAINEIQSALNPLGLPYGINFIHNPMESFWEDAIVDLLFLKGVTKIEASAFMRITPALVRYVVKDLRISATGDITRKNFVIAKLSRPEVAEQFMSPAPELILQQLLKEGKINQQEAELARKIPLAEDITVEADSGGHTDNRPLTALFTTIQGLGQKLSRQFKFKTPFRIGAAGGLGTPMAVAAAFSLGASYVLTGSINQCSVEAAQSERAKAMLAKAGIADTMMAPAADMFEMGVKVQVLKKGSMWPVRGQKLYELYKEHSSLEEIPLGEREKIEKEIFRDSLENIWAVTKAFFEQRDPRQVEKAERDPKHKMALVFRWYLGMGSRWAIQGVEDRQLDYQIWCGPAQGAFNEWAKGSFLEDAKNRTIVQIALNLMEGAAAVTRAQQLRTYGVMIPEEAYQPRPQKII
jgi:trans-AT polyketide synthase, acyltransferase and oxidoreductase domains